jgi:hypothetical protein
MRQSPSFAGLRSSEETGAGLPKKNWTAKQDPEDILELYNADVRVRPHPVFPAGKKMELIPGGAV